MNFKNIVIEKSNVNLNDIVLHNYDGLAVKPDISDYYNSIVETAIVYHDHGDQFLFVEYKDGRSYLYGIWFDRPFAAKYSDKDRLEKEYVIPPRMNKEKLDGESSSFFYNSISNEVGRILDHTIRERDGWYNTDKIFKSKDDFGFQYAIKRIEEALNEYYEGDTQYDCDWWHHETVNWLLRHEFEADDLSELLHRVNNMHWTSKDENGLDGVAGVKEFRGDEIICDGVNMYVKNGKQIPISEMSKFIKRIEEEDEWGCSSIIINLKKMRNTKHK